MLCVGVGVTGGITGGVGLGVGGSLGHSGCVWHRVCVDDIVKLCSNHGFTQSAVA